MSELLRFLEVLFIIHDIIVNESLDKRRQLLLELSISGKHRGHHLWLLTKSYTAIPKNLRRQAEVIFVWYPKEKADLKMIHDENDFLTNDELVVARSILRESNMRAYIYEMMKEEIEKKVITEEEKKIITQEKHRGRIT